MADWATATDELTALGQRVVALSVDEPVRTEALRHAEGWPFPVLCDQEREVVRSLDLFNPDRGGIAVPATFVLDAERRVRMVSVDQVRFRATAASVLEFLKGATPPEERVEMKPGGRGWWRVITNVARFGMRSPRR